MDHARKIGKTDTTFPRKRKSSPPSTICDRVAIIEDENIIEDRRLVNWRRWLGNREKHYQCLEKFTGRERKDLLMIRDDFRRKVETREIIECATDVILPASDKYRGNPGFWTTPAFLPKRGNPALPDIAVTLTKKQTGACKPYIERIALPELIRREKGLPVDQESMTLPKADDYLREREKTLSRRINFIQPRDPKITQLSVKGQKLGGKSLKKVRKMRIVKTESLEAFNTDDESELEVAERDNAILLIVQDREVGFNGRASSGISDKHFSTYDDSRTWSLIFNATNSNLCQREICLENRGICAITYRWRLSNRNTSFAMPKQTVSAFFFNKNEGLLLPQEIVKLPVWFRSRVPCTTTEIWNMITEPAVCSKPLIFRFWGSTVLSVSPDTDDRESALDNLPNSRNVEQYLNRCIRDAKIYEIVESIINEVPSQRNDVLCVPYSNLFLERDIFLARNPIHFYHHGMVQNLKKIHEDAAGHDSPSWNLTLIDLRSVLLEIENLDLRNQTMNRFNQSCRDSLKPNLYDPMENAKTLMVYNLLCSFANKFEVESDYVANKCSQMLVREEKISGEAPGDALRSTSVTSSQVSTTTPRKKAKRMSRSGRSRTTSTSSISTMSNRAIAEDVAVKEISERCTLYDEVFHVRIREIFSNTIVAICAIVDTINNLNSRKI